MRVSLAAIQASMKFVDGVAGLGPSVSMVSRMLKKISGPKGPNVKV